MAKIIINDKYEINNVDFNDHFIIECFLRMPTDEEIALVARFEEEICHIKVIEKDETLLSVHGKFSEVIINQHSGSIDFLIEKKD